MAGPIAFLDSNVLYPAELRSFLMYLALSGSFQAHWSRDVHEEWISSLLSKRPDLTRAQLERTRQLMDKHAVGALVTGYERLIPRLTLPDRNDRHVLAAAIRCGAQIIVTKNLRHFPQEELRKFSVEARHPDLFVRHLISIHPERVCGAAEAHRQSLKNPPKTLSEYFSTLELQGIPKSVSALRRLFGDIET
jgi:hypothetical protein